MMATPIRTTETRAEELRALLDARGALANIAGIIQGHYQGAVESINPADLRAFEAILGEIRPVMPDLFGSECGGGI